MSDEYEKIWQEPVVAQSRYSLGILLEELRKTTETSVWIASVLAEFRT
jgi:hypothetical protein